MQIYEVRISRAAYADMAELRRFLDAMLSEESAVRYANIWIGLQTAYNLQRAKKNHSFMQRLEQVRRIAAVL